MEKWNGIVPSRLEAKKNIKLSPRKPEVEIFKELTIKVS